MTQLMLQTEFDSTGGKKISLVNDEWPGEVQITESFVHYPSRDTFLVGDHFVLNLYNAKAIYKHINTVDGIWYGKLIGCERDAPASR